MYTSMLFTTLPLLAVDRGDAAAYECFRRRQADGLASVGCSPAWGPSWTCRLHARDSIRIDRVGCPCAPACRRSFASIHLPDAPMPFVTDPGTRQSRAAVSIVTTGDALAHPVREPRSSLTSKEVSEPAPAPARATQNEAVSEPLASATAPISGGASTPPR